MKKSISQIIMSIYMLCVFLLGAYILYGPLTGIIAQAFSGSYSFGFYGILTLLIFALFAIAQIFFLLAAIQIFRKGEYRILKVLLYMSIPSFNILGYVGYLFMFGPFVLLSIGTYVNQLNFMFNLNFHTFAVQYDLNFASDSNGLISVGINLVPFLFLILIRRLEKRS
jgi:hypothetical protein